MIRINLLPEQFRRSERTSAKIFAATLMGVILVCSTAGWLGYVWFGELGELEARRQSTQDHLAGLQDRCRYFDSLTSERGEYEKRSRTIQDIGISRILWTEILDQVYDVVNNDGNTERHMAWFKGIQVTKGDNARGPTVTMPGYVQGKEMKKVADFHEDFEASKFYVDVAETSLPQGVLEKEAKRNPPEAFFFTMKYGFKAPKDWGRNKKPARPTAPGK